MNNITVGSKVRLVDQALILRDTMEASKIATPDLFFRVIARDHEHVRVRGINRGTPLGEHVWPVQAFALADE